MLEIKKVSKSYTTGDFTQKALNDVSIKFRKNEFVSILGPSGSGKTTLLNIIGGLDRYDSGDLIINNKSTKKFKDQEWDAYRNICIGFVFQSYNLIPHLSVLENVSMGMTLTGVNRRLKNEKAEEALKRVGLLEHKHKKPNQLSGGQMQRVAIARALVNDPEIILADEPTGALDSKTSVQIMNLIKEIAKDKLVIMVTHNSEIAHEYSNRIIEMRDGKVISDSNDVSEFEKLDADLKMKKTSMNFFTALNLSFNNIITKKGRTILTAFASSIGIIGISLILSLSNGLDKQIAQFEQGSMSNMPIIISEQAMKLDEDTFSLLKGDSSLEDYPDINYVIPKKPMEQQVTHENIIKDDYIDYIEKADPEGVSGISYYRYTNLNILTKSEGKIKPLETNNYLIGSNPKKLSEDQKTVIGELYDCLAGREAKEANELIILVNSKNNLDTSLVKALGLDPEKEQINFDDLLKGTLKFVLNNDYYQKNGKYYTINQNLENLYENKSMELKVVGIFRMKDIFPPFVTNSSILYTEKFLDYVIEENNKSEIVKDQEKVNYNVLTGEAFDITTEEGKKEKNITLSYLGKKSVPHMIQLYPRNFDGKEKLLEYLDEYNKGKELSDQIVYTDQAEIISSMSGNIMKGVTVVLIAFSAISLVVSSIMIGIITYISVLERTKEIGILRSLGARKKDISRVFNAETFIIGFASGLLGIGITYLSLMPINILLKKLSSLKDVAVLNPFHALILIVVSITLTLIGGWIPAKIASKKDPVIALRTE